MTAKCRDLMRKCDKNAEGAFSTFLNEAQQATVEREIGSPVGYNTGFFGGYAEAGRKLFGVFPEWLQASDEEYPVSVLKIRKTYKRELTHRDYLGTVLSTGIERECVGDIVVDEDVAYVYVLSEMADYIALGMDKIANVGVKVSVEKPSDIVLPEQKFEILNTVAASERADAVLAAALNVSRKLASELIKNEKVSLNHLPMTNVSKTLKEGDLLSVRGYGRFIFSEIGGGTRSQRIHIKIKKYI